MTATAPLSRWARKPATAAASSSPRAWGEIWRRRGTFISLAPLIKNEGGRVYRPPSPNSRRTCLLLLRGLLLRRRLLRSLLGGFLRSLSHELFSNRTRSA